MNVLIKGMNMPSGLAERGFVIRGDGRVRTFTGAVIKGCYAVEVPTPLEEAEPKHAYVIIDEDGNMECSNCGSGNCFDNYCGHCGAKLENS